MGKFKFNLAELKTAVKSLISVRQRLLKFKKCRILLFLKKNTASHCTRKKEILPSPVFASSTKIDTIQNLPLTTKSTLATDTFN